MKKSTLLFILIHFIFNQVNGQTLTDQFYKLMSEKDTVGQIRLLEKWESTNSEDPELYIAYYNYYVNKSKREIITLGQNPKGKDVLQIMDQDKTKKEPVGYIYGDTSYDPEFLNKGFTWLNRGIAKFPNRLDMRFGKIYMFGVIGDYENFTKEIITTIDYSEINKNAWTWSDSQPLENPKESMLRSIQDYQIQLYNTEDDSLLENMKRIAEAILKYYPNHIESLTNISIVYLIKKQYDKALEFLISAEKINPKDTIVLNNIAQAYKLKGDFKNSIKYYELIIIYGDDQIKQFAQEQIIQLRQKK